MFESRYYVRLEEKQKNKKLFDLLDTLEFNQVAAGVLVFELFRAGVGILTYAGFLK